METNFTEMWLKGKFRFKEIHLKMTSVKWWPSLYVLPLSDLVSKDSVSDRTHYIGNWAPCQYKGGLSRCGDSRVNTLRPRQDGRYFADDALKCIFLNENVWISLKIPLKFVSKVPINNIPALVQIMVWRRPGDKLLSEPMLVFVPTHICVTRPQWVNESMVVRWYSPLKQVVCVHLPSLVSLMTRWVLEYSYHYLHLPNWVSEQCLSKILIRCY